MPTINATVYPNEAYVLVEADWTDIPTVTHAQVTRRNTVTGETVTLRPYIAYDSNGYLLLNCGLGLWWDTEPPLNVPLEYCTVAADVTGFFNSNPDMETTTLPWASVSSTLTQSAVFAHSGTFSLLSTPLGTSNTNAVADLTPYTYVADVPLTMQAWILTPQGHNSAVVGVVTESDTGIVADVFSDTHVLFPGEWTLVSFTITPNESGHFQAIYVTFFGRPPATTLFYIDDVGIMRTSAETATACETVTVTSESVWLKNPYSPCLDIEIGLCEPGMDFDCEVDSRVSYAGMANDELDANTALGIPANRKYPIPVNRQRRAPTSELRLIAHDCDARDIVLAINDPGTPLLFQAPAEYCIPDRYISVATLTEARFSVDQREAFRLILLPYAVVQRPPGPADAPCGLRFMDLCDIYTSWQSMTLSGLDWVDLLLGAASNNAPSDDPDAMRTWDEVETEFTDWDDVEAGGTRDWDELRDGL
jgi:hypothetical protein